MPQRSLDTAKSKKKDEFYTQLADIEDELRHYREQFRGKVVFCNCDDPYESNFFKYFASNFNFLGLKKLIATSYTDSPLAGNQLPLDQIEGLKPDGKQPFVVEISEVPDLNQDGAVDLTDVETLLRSDKNTATPLNGNGDFRSEESIRYLEQADIVCTNPPFSLFREFLSLLFEHGKQFLIIGNKNSITYKEVFTLIQADQLWLGYRNVNSDMWFIVPNGEPYERLQNGKPVKHIMACWFTNLDTSKRHEAFVMYRTYTPELYPTYVNYDAIEVDRVADIPMDYEGQMGVPITFLDKYNPEQFRIVGSNLTHAFPMSAFAPVGTYPQGGPSFYTELPGGRYKRVYTRLLVCRRSSES